MDRIVVPMAYARATKNKYVYEAEGSSAPEAVHSLYLEKWAVGNSPPTRVTVVVEVA